MDFTLFFQNSDELATFCMSDNDAQNAMLAERIAELARTGAVVEGMLCSIKDNPQ